MTMVAAWALSLAQSLEQMLQEVYCASESSKALVFDPIHPDLVIEGLYIDAAHGH